MTRDFLFVSGRRFSLSSLTDLHTIRSRTGIAGLVAGFLCGDLAILVAGWPVSPWVTLGLLGLTTTILAALVVRRRLGRRYELWARYRGEDTRLLVMRDSERYGQVCRAVLRARETPRGDRSEHDARGGPSPQRMEVRAPADVKG